MNKDLLTRPFPSDLIKQRQGQGGKTLSYLETHVVIARLNEGCDAWAFEIVKHEIVEDEVLVIGKLVADGITKMAFGGASVSRDREGRMSDLGDTYKAAASDALKKAASLFGIGLQLYDGAAKAAAAAPRRYAASPPVDDRLTARQLAAIHAATRRRGIGPQRLTTMLIERWDKDGPQLLTRREASDLISELSEPNGAHP